MEVSVLGPLHAVHEGRDVTPTAPKVRNLLALLALRHDRLVTTGTLMTELWGDHPPLSALATLQTYVYQLRKALRGRELLVTKPLGYVLHLEPGRLDADRFSGLLSRARADLAAGQPEQAAEALAEALALSSTPPLSDLDTGPVLESHLGQLAENRLQAHELWAEADLRLGRHHDVITRLQALVVEHPFHEDFHRKLMLALRRAGRRSEAMEVYRKVRRTLVEELGIEPSAALQALHESLLDDAADTAGHTADVPQAVPSEVPSAAPAPYARPAQLPPDSDDFVGRAAELRRAAELLVPGTAPQATRLMAVTGMPGAGKTALALRAAHQAAARYPDGQFHADLRGAEEHPADPGRILGGFLRATGLREADLPDDLAERSQLFRSWTAGRAVLVVLDDAADEEQLRPLLPGGPRCAVLTTSRAPLSGLSGLQRLELGEMPAEECVQLLRSAVGEGRVDSDPDAVRTIVAMCGRLPLAVRAVAARMRARPQFPLRAVATRLADERLRLRELRHGELDVAARLAPAYRRLDPGGRSLLAGIAAHAPQTFTARSAARWTGFDPVAAELLLEQLTERHFLRLHGYDAGGEDVYALPDLMRSFALTPAAA